MTITYDVIINEEFTLSVMTYISLRTRRRWLTSRVRLLHSFDCVSLKLVASFRSRRVIFFERMKAVRNPMIIMRYPSPNRIQISVNTLYNVNTVSLSRC